jgi:putative pyruvate formate lyase activating enzyme
MNFIPSYINLLQSGELKLRAEKAYANLNSCTSCPRDCNVDRINGDYGICTSGSLPIVSSYTPHFGEEPVLSGTKGAGNIFFGNCNLKCIYCQNFEISQNPLVEKQKEVTHNRLAEIMIELQSANGGKGCHNIGLVSPSHFSATILKSIYIAAQNGLKLPIIYNTNGYDSVEMLKLYDGVVDIYLPDFKYGNSEYAKTYSLVDNYFEKAKEALREMYRQVGDELVYDGDVVVRGLIIRHLILPNDLSDTEKVFKFIAEELSPKIHISLMSQYYPTNKAYKDILIDRALRIPEYEKAIQLLEKYGLHNGWIQEMESAETYRPNFNEDRANPFKN